MVQWTTLLKAAVLSLGGVSCRASLMEAHTFQPPFEHTDPSGTNLPASPRVLAPSALTTHQIGMIMGVSKDWKLGGVANVNTNFVRLTPDRQSKKGALWSRKALGTDTFSTVLTFRISGQGKKFFGDGMALWFMQQAYYVEGDFHGSVERFTGFGVIFDTFKNTESLAYHRDVAIVFNDGQRTSEVMMEKKEGCDASIRYHEQHGDFSVDSAARAKIVLEGGTKVTVLIDARNSGTFQECASMVLPLSDTAAAKSWHVGLTASTGQLADNHDVLSLVTFSDLAAHDQMIKLTENLPAFGRGQGVSPARFERLEDKVSELIEKLEYLHHHLEHELAAVEDHNKVTIAKLQGQEAISEGRIDELEKKIKNSVSQDVHGRISDMTNTMDSQLVSRITTVERMLKEKIDDSVTAVTNSSGGWKLPFVLLLCLVGGAGAGLYAWYQQLKKTHML